MTELKNKDQQHPLYNQDRALINSLMTAAPTDLNLAELARMRIRYNGFPGARDLQADLDRVMQTWNLTEAELFEKTRQLHASKSAYVSHGNKSETEDWS
ncbi:DUF3288 family protein [Gloeocapsopsis dulcis]|uniref:DUF3288 domain-containing protein n=1 Tax=Gloeocapsopsis dulcis AAB1 = 1H9 TaxID=1433147 RepID=A0A6N8G1J4_9CHRO|nr:DUF3288 family protein [Gloeocapsopsis dulcis]MUL39203.1 hypothetical protein [Gloeocapsopsis dulcis AAB1 = 1H9]WNN90756.1 DUF3288 family protein [Gloeocapsopsis dulcis]